MKQTSWIQFAWDLSDFSAFDSNLAPHYQITPAAANDAPEVQKVFSSAFLLDSTWNPAIRETMEMVQPWLDRAFVAETYTCLALRHGARIIGASILSTNPAAENHLVPGPCVLVEYRNRGFGTALLAASLDFLRQAGISRVVALTRENAPVAKFLYPKFRGVAVREDISGLLAA